VAAFRAVTVFCDQRLIEADPVIGGRKVSADDAAEDQRADQKNRKIICGHEKSSWVSKNIKQFYIKEPGGKSQGQGERWYEEGMEDRSSGIYYTAVVFDLF